MFFYGSNNRNNDGFGLDFGATSGGIGTIDPFTNGSTDPMGDNKSSGLMANTNQWVHFAMTWDGTTLRGVRQRRREGRGRRSRRCSTPA